MIIEMVPNPDPQYGDVAKSAALFSISGRGVHNRHHPHELIRWDFTGTDHEGREGNGLRFSARAIAIPATPAEAKRPRYEVAIGDHVTVDGTEYVITARPVADPILVPAAETEGVE